MRHIDSSRQSTEWASNRISFLEAQVRQLKKQLKENNSKSKPKDKKKRIQ